MPTTRGEIATLGFTDVTVELGAPHVAVVEIRRPPANYFDAGLLERIGSVYGALATRGDIRAIVLCSEGKHFCAGADFTGASSAEAVTAEDGARRLYAAGIELFRSPLPVVAALQGATIGGGVGLALSADFRVAETGSRFATNFSRLGFHPGFGLSVTLPRAVGRQFAAEMLLTGRTVSAEEAAAAGLCDRLVASGEVRAEAVRFAVELAAAAPLAVRSIRSTLRSDLADEVAAIVDHEREEQARLRATADFTEGVAAAAERRDPTFTGE